MKITMNYLEISQLYAAVCHGQRERGGSNLACNCNIPCFFFVPTWMFLTMIRNTLSVKQGKGQQKNFMPFPLDAKEVIIHAC